MGSMLLEAEHDERHWNRHLFLPGVIYRREAYAPVAVICDEAREVIATIGRWASPMQGWGAASLKQHVFAIFACRSLQDTSSKAGLH